MMHMMYLQQYHLQSNMSKNHPLYSIIIPTYNQRQNIPLLLYLFHQTVKQHSINLQIIIVDDSSPDGTASIAKDLSQHFTALNISVLERKAKLGLGSAYRAGFALCSGAFIILMDADLSHHPKYIPSMISKQLKNNADIVMGSRYIEHGGVEGWNFYRKLTSRTANFITQFVLGTQCSDFTGSFRLYKKNVLQRLLAVTKTQGYSFQMEIIVRAKRAGLNIEEVPIVFVDRLFGSSKLATSQIVTYLKGTAQLFFEA